MAPNNQGKKRRPIQAKRFVTRGDGKLRRLKRLKTPKRNDLLTSSSPIRPNPKNGGHDGVWDAEVLDSLDDFDISNDTCKAQVHYTLLEALKGGRLMAMNLAAAAPVTVDRAMLGRIDSRAVNETIGKEKDRTKRFDLIEEEDQWWKDNQERIEMEFLIGLSGQPPTPPCNCNDVQMKSMIRICALGMLYICSPTISFR
jgi:hypothetical protein